MALLMLVMVSLVATFAIRRATLGEQVSKGVRTHTVAFQAAETALRYCEDQILKNGTDAPTLVAYDDTGKLPDQWNTRSNWAPSKGLAKVVSATAANSGDTKARALPDEALPRCMAERLRMRNEEGAEVEAFLVTAVGFSPDYRLNANGTPDTGSEVWLQSTITRPR
jgi:type IV pilus assembly protein PilX